ncbi:N,N-dimethylformamidase beta subunit family domain-containing protein [Microbacterium sp. B2969]|uniref:N,N-dimethylformamidase beta subunit family domain-containing protein n=1 Tax=Microbacterium alkaliflavum TaxID=3248839 RepID=A0ABW7Q591_9MICO
MAERIFTADDRGPVSPPAGWEFRSGVFVGSGRADLLGYHPINGSLWVGENSGNAFNFQHWGAVSPPDGWWFDAGDFTTSNRDDVFGYRASDGALWMGKNAGTHFELEQWGSVVPAAGWQFGVGYFTGGAKADLFGYHPGNGSLWVGRNTGSGFSFTQWGTVPTTSVWQFVVGDFTGSGRPDVAGYDSSDGSIWIGENEGGAFVLTQRGALQPTVGWQLCAGYFNGRAKADIFGYHPSNGSMWVGTFDGTRYRFEQWDTAAPAAGWQFVPGQFTEDTWVDLLGYLPATGQLRLSRSTARPLEGYCWPLSAAPGERISFMTSGGGACTSTVRRYTSTSADLDTEDKKELDFQSPVQPTPPEPWHTGCGWSETFKLDVPASWKSGIYAAACVDEEGRSADITFVVKAKQSQRSKVALLANTNTWLAYDGWGGQSKYSGLARISLMRPMVNAAPTTPSAFDWHLTRGELWIQGWLESEGYKPDMYTDLDFHENGCDAGQYSILLCGTHPEYWTPEMYDNLVAYLDAGGSFAYLGGNGLFEACVYDPLAREMRYREGVEGGSRVPALFRVRQPLRPERSVIGVATERCAVVGSPYEVVDAGHFLFDGIGISNGDRFGQEGLNTGFGNGKASAWEVDTASGIGAVSIPYDCAMEPPAVIPPSDLPGGLAIIASGVFDGVGPGGDITYYDHPGGGFVFSVGSLTFGGSLVVDPIIQQLMHNVMGKAGVVPA